MRLEPPLPGRDEVRVWHTHVAPLEADPDATARTIASLPDADRARAAKYRLERDRAMFVGGRVMARRLVGDALGIDRDGWQWREGERGRPEIGSPATPLRFNLAHSAGLVVCALAHGRDVGVDVEDLERVALDPKLVRRYCAPAEADDIEAQGDRWRDRFLTYWTLKEAYLKARGLGIAVPLAEVCFTLAPSIRIGFLGSLAGTSTDWTFHLERPTARHLVAVAAQGKTARVSSAEFQLDARIG
jgi:4'-phosphopantetheinyl transferase